MMMMMIYSGKEEKRALMMVEVWELVFFFLFFFGRKSVPWKTNSFIARVLPLILLQVTSPLLQLETPMLMNLLLLNSHNESIYLHEKGSSVKEQTGLKSVKINQLSRMYV